MNKTKIFTLLAGLALAGAPELVQAYQIVPNPNPYGSTIIVITPDAENFSSFENYGSLQINAGGTLLNDTALLHNAGTLNNAGTLTSFFGALINDGTLNNAGTLSSLSSTFVNAGATARCPTPAP